MGVGRTRITHQHPCSCSYINYIGKDKRLLTYYKYYSIQPCRECSTTQTTPMISFSACTLHTSKFRQKRGNTLPSIYRIDTTYKITVTAPTPSDPIVSTQKSVNSPPPPLPVELTEPTNQILNIHKYYHWILNSQTPNISGNGTYSGEGSPSIFDPQKWYGLSFTSK